MVWFKVDDNLAFHQKTLLAGNSAMGLWVRAGSWSAQHLKDGFIPDEVVATMGGQKPAAKLVNVGFWMRVEGGYQFHQWAERQPTRAEVEEERKAAKLRKDRWKERRRNGEGTETERRSDGVRNGGKNDAHARAATRPDPTRPDLVKEEPSPSERAAQKRGTRLPEDWKPTEADQAWQREKGIPELDARRALEVFRNYWPAQAGKNAVKLDWSLTWRNWLLREQQERPTNRAQPQRPMREW